MWISLCTHCGWSETTFSLLMAEDLCDMHRGTCPDASTEIHPVKGHQP